MIRTLLAAVVLTATAGCTPVPGLTLAAPATSDTGQDVVRVIDGDTFVTTQGTVRVLVMDSCEKGTKGGAAATAEAHRLLDGKRVRLTAEPGHDTDRYRRLLRYVQLPDGRDYARTMLAEPHTGVYAKKSDASAEETERGREADVDGRTC